MRKLRDWITRTYDTGDDVREHAQTHEGCGLPQLWRYRHVFTLTYGTGYGLALVSIIAGGFAIVTGMDLSIWEALAYTGLPSLFLSLAVFEALASLFLRRRIEVHESRGYCSQSEWLQELSDAPTIFQRHAEAHGCGLAFGWGRIRHAYPVVFALAVAVLVYLQLDDLPRPYLSSPPLAVEVLLSFLTTCAFTVMATEGVRRVEMLKILRLHEGQNPARSLMSAAQGGAHE